MAKFKITVVYVVDGVDRPSLIREQLAKISTDANWRSVGEGISEA